MIRLVKEEALSKEEEITGACCGFFPKTRYSSYGHSV
jgi:hypothetical protein